MNAPEKIWINPVYGQHPEDWDFSDGQHLTRQQKAKKVEYIRKCVVKDLIYAVRVLLDPESGEIDLRLARKDAIAVIKKIEKDG